MENRILKFLPKAKPPQQTQKRLYEGLTAGPRHEFLWFFLSANLNEEGALLVDVDGEVLSRMVDEEIWMFGTDFQLNFPGSQPAMRKLEAMPPGLYMMGVRFDFDPATISEAYPAWRDITIHCLSAGPLKVDFPGRPDGSRPK